MFDKEKQALIENVQRAASLYDSTTKQGAYPATGALLKGKR